VTLEDSILLLKAENAKLKAKDAESLQRIKALEEKVELLLKLLEEKEVKKDSHNSHNPPSQDKSKPKRNQSLRKKTGRKPGGQSGHKGHTLKQKSDPDKHHDLKSNYCEECGNDLSKLEHRIISKRQVVEVPPIKPIYIEYRQHSCNCPCGHEQKASYPENVNAPIQYGSSVIALVSYFNVFQYVPYARLKELFTAVFLLPISEGSIENLLNKAAQKAIPVYKAIFNQMKAASYAGSDETGAKVNGEKWWVWVWQNIENTFIKASNSRGFDTIKDTFPDGLPNATIGSDRWAAQLKMTSKNKQLCFPHLQRELVFLEETEKNPWATHFKDLLKRALELRHTVVSRNQAYQKGNFEVYQLEGRLNRLLARSILKEKSPKTATFQKSMIKNRNYLFPCLYDLEIPPDNNASERAIRNVKVKQKISGQFKSGQDAFCVLRSVIDTFRKRNLNVLEYLGRIMAI
jgi:transposase